MVALAAGCDSGTSDSGAGGAITGGNATAGDDAVSAGKSASGGATSNGGAATTKAGAAAGGETTGGTSSGGAAGAAGNAGGSGKPATAGAGNGGAGNGGTAGSASMAGGISYTTDFDTTESPLSEKGAWHHDGLDWTVVETSKGFASNTQALGVGRSGPTQYNDSYAYLLGFPANQQASALVHLGSIDGSCTHEVEILLRWADSAHNARGYECNVAFDGSYAQIVRWNGAVGDYTYLNSGSVPGGIHENDNVSASIIGDQIKLSVNGTVRASAQDRSFADGNPGIGFWRGSSGCGTIGDYGFTHFTAGAAAK